MKIRYQPASPEQLLQAFQTLDQEGHGYLTKEYISTLMTQDGEPFTQDELDEMLEIAIDPHTQTVPYEYYINQLMVRYLIELGMEYCSYSNFGMVFFIEYSVKIQ